MTYETKADPLDAVFETAAPAVEALRGEVARLTSLVTARSVERPALAETKAATVANGPKGGVAVPETIDAVIDSVLAAESPIRAIAQVVDVGSANYRKLITTSGVISGWVSETAGRPETDTPDFAEIAPPMGELYANPAASQAMLDDAMFDVEAWLGGEIGREFARAEGIAFVGGDGINKPRGFLATPTSSAGDATRPFGTLQTLASGAAGGFAATSPEDRLIDLVHTLAAPYRQGASWVMNAGTLARIRKMKDGDGAFLWQPALAADQPATLLGYPVIEAAAMPDIADGSLSIAFGNFRAGYLIAQRRETVVLRDPFSNKPFVHFYATKRVGGTVVDSRAIKLMVFSA
ncbi:phage major capsid protein [Polymorphobacter fuscus]|uniref:Phage major capsid protein n=1 Tax=Sandarakinorhabdus fusca TaxID=1439888 RepID=A0A7C9GM72_9SPHN|nr:phage major capsid protein [Polymorphobacter fuscus]KAB7648177.1 phage major capsid protein [Polymorphobacter fuscus]MQT15675.1 phage major capsid protein [Polymorphobacter fuscus]NJC08054.1 HK97 family phage major capsid protein [Polymorphobacter fuscus]